MLTLTSHREAVSSVFSFLCGSSAFRLIRYLAAGTLRLSSDAEVDSQIRDMLVRLGHLADPHAQVWVIRAIANMAFGSPSAAWLEVSLTTQLAIPFPVTPSSIESQSNSGALL